MGCAEVDEETEEDLQNIQLAEFYQWNVVILTDQDNRDNLHAG